MQKWDKNMNDQMITKDANLEHMFDKMALCIWR